MSPQFIPNIIKNIPISPWILGAIAAALWIAILFPAKNWILRALRKDLMKQTNWLSADAIIDALSPAVSLLVIAGGLALMAWIMPLSQRSEHAFYIILVAIVVLALMILTDRICRRMLHRVASGSPAFQGEIGLIQGVVRGIVIGVALMIFLDSVGISITPLIASLGIGTAAVALALQDTLANLFAGIYMVAERPIQAGHFISLEGGEEGYVEKVGWRSTQIRMLSDVVVVVPNSKLAGSVIKNFSLPKEELAVKVDVGVDYASDLEKVEAVTLMVAREVLAQVNGSIANFEPRLRFHEFGDSSINFTIWIGAQDYISGVKLKHEFIKRLHARYGTEGISIPFPMRTIDFAEKTVMNIREIFSDGGSATARHAKTVS
jgi:small-conductance mechanosensitive channel